MFHPGDDFAAFVGLLDGKMRHGMAGRGAVPVLLSWREPCGVARSQALDLPSMTLRITHAAEDKEHLAAWMSVPGSTRACREGNDRAALRGRVVGAEHWLNPNLAIKPVGRPSLLVCLASANHPHAFQATPHSKGEESANPAVQ